MKKSSAATARQRRQGKPSIFLTAAARNNLLTPPHSFFRVTMSSSTTSGSTTRRSTRTRGGATSDVSTSSSSALQPVATNTPSKIPTAATSEKASARNKTSSKSNAKSTAKNSTISSSYSLRKRASSTSTTNEGEDNSTNNKSSLAMVNHGALYSDKAFEALLRHHEHRGLEQREEKRRKLEGPYPYRPNPDGTIGNGNITVALDQLPGPVITLIFEMLPRCRDILNLAYQSKYLLSFVERRHDLIVRAAVHENAMAKIAPKKKGGGNNNNNSNSGGSGGGDGADANAADQQQQLLSSGAIGWSGNKKADGSRKIMTQLADDVRSRAMHVPSPLRLLRLLCAQSCERCEQCWDYNTEKETAGTRLGVDGAARPFGMALCHKCSNDACRTIPRWWNHWGRTEEKILKIGGSKLFHPTAVADLMEGPDGEKIGPFLNARHIMQLSSSYRNDGIDAQKDAFSKLCEEAYGKEGEEQYDEYENAAAQFVQYYDEAVEALEVFYAKQDDGKEDNRKAIIARKKETLIQILPILEEAVEELPDDIKALAMDYHWCEDDTHLPLRFSLPQVHQKLVTFIRAPSYASQKRVDDAVASIRENLNTFASHQEFTSFSFLTAQAGEQQGGSGSESDRQLKLRLKQKLLNHIQQADLTNLATLLNKHEDPTRRWGYYAQDNFTLQFYDLLSRRSYKAALLNLLASREELSGIISATLVVDGEALDAGDPIDHRNLTKTIFKKIKVDEQYNVATSSFGDFVDVLKLCKAEYTKLSRAARDYLQTTPVIEYLAGAPGWQGGFTRQRAIGQVWMPENRVLRGYYSPWNNRSNVPEGLQGLKPYQLLLERKFDKLLEVHKFYQRSGSAGGVH